MVDLIELLKNLGKTQALPFLCGQRKNSACLWPLWC